ncbi:RNB domain-containing ribonuclease [Demequina sp.]|uniref:RNB domain-containing ribonuclease n=1 Tax=Demequina sp. TaxID=2050685 RepID=UPI003D0EAACE
MAVRRLVARVPLDELAPTFAEIRRRHEVAEVYPRDALADVDAARAANAHGGELAHVDGERADRTDLELVTIDPEGSRDLDQALAVEATDAGWLVHYAIADVGAHVTPGGALDRDTWSRVETVYCPDKRVGLHPPQLSEGFASLLPGQRTKAVLWSLEVASDGALGAARVERAWVTSRRQYSYDELRLAPPDEAKSLVDVMRTLGDARREYVRAGGGVTLPKPSQEVDVDNGQLTLEFRAATGIEDDNAQISLLTGEAAARMMLEAGVGVLRTMPPAQPEDIERLRRQALAIGVEWPHGASYGEVLDALDPATPKAAAFLTQATRLFRGAAWEPFDGQALPVPEHTTHGALARPYAHVTAPLRRLVDRYGTEVCLAHTSGRAVPEWVLAALPRLGETMMAGVRVGSAIDRECVDAVEAAVLKPHVGETFTAVGLDDRTIQLENPAVVATCAGEVKVGERQRVRLVTADAGKAEFQTVT